MFKMCDFGMSYPLAVLATVWSKWLDYIKSNLKGLIAYSKLFEQTSYHVYPIFINHTENFEFEIAFPIIMG